jgi:ATP-dependent 26S proteasome regulatory subunit
VTRASENINSIQSLLNLGDGILGSLLDLRIVATTNADELKMEAAILRPGRLSRMLEVGFLDPKTAQGVFHRLIPGAKLPEKLLDIKGREFKVTLAEVYSLARQSGWEPPSRKVQEDEDPDYID